MTIKTPEQIAEEQMEAFSFIDHEEYDHESPDRDEADVAEQSYGFISEQIIAAIKADRAQLVEIIETLKDAAGQWAQELDQYIILSAAETSAADAARYTAQMERIDAAIDAVSAATAPERTRP